MKTLTCTGLGVNVKQAKRISGDEEEILWSKELLGEDDPRTLVNTLVASLFNWQVLFAFKWRGTQPESSVFLNWRLLMET